jgi:hypothetical protein
VLRDTDGERFVVSKKGAVFKEVLLVAKNNTCAQRDILMIENSLYVIIYPHALELFASRKNQRGRQNSMNFSWITDGPP